MSQAKYPLAITGLGMISCLGEGAEINAAAMRCGYDGFAETPFMQPYHAEPQLGASITLAGDTQLRGIEKLAYLGQSVIKQAIEQLSPQHADNPIQLLMCLPDLQHHAHYLQGNKAHQTLLDEIHNYSDIPDFHSQSQVYYQSRCGFTRALQQAQSSLYQDTISHVLIVGIDSLLNSASLGYYGGDLYGEGRRLLGDGHSNGFIPGEAATAILLSKPDSNHANTPQIVGVGIGKESASYHNSLTDDPDILRGKGLSDAIKAASQQAHIDIHNTAYRVASVSGEDYFFTEAALAQIKSLKQKVAEHPLWHPADSIGEVGAAVGGAITIMTYYALQKKYALGNQVLCHISNDNEQRGAFILKQSTQERDIQHGQ